MKRHDPIPLVQAGGMQPYLGSTPQTPGPALLAMLQGSMASGYHPQDASRELQKAAKKRPPSLLDMLMR